jgi:APA family basic amino acid/polyamine antiporter
MSSSPQTDTEMKKSLTLWNYFSIGFGAIIGTGWLLLVGDWMEIGGGPVAALLAFAVGAVMLFPVGAVFGELSAAIPISGGTVEFIYRAFGNRTSYIASWFLVLGNAIICPWESIAIGALAGELLPALKSFPLYSVMGYPVYLPTLLIALAISCYVIYMNWYGAEQSAKLQSAMTKILLVGMFTAIGIAVFKGESSNLMPIFHASESTPNFFHGFLMVLVMTPFFYAGFDTIPQQAEEAAEGTDYKKFGAIIGLALLTSGLFYAIAICAFGSLIPWREFLTYPIPALTVLDQRLGMTLFAKFLLFAATCGIISTLNAFYGASTRIMLGMARKGQLPVAFTKLHPVHKTPQAGNIVLAILTLAGPFFGKKLLVPLTNVSSLAFITACMLVACAAFKLRSSEPNLNRPYKVPGGIAGIGAAVVICATVVLLMVLPFSPASLKPLEWVITGSWIAIGLVFMALQNRNRTVEYSVTVECSQEDKAANK